MNEQTDDEQGICGSGRVCGRRGCRGGRVLSSPESSAKP